MYTFHCLDLKTSKDFYRTFYSQFKARIFLNKCRYSKRVLVLSYTGNLNV